MESHKRQRSATAPRQAVHARSVHRPAAHTSQVIKSRNQGRTVLHTYGWMVIVGIAVVATAWMVWLNQSEVNDEPAALSQNVLIPTITSPDGAALAYSLTIPEGDGPFPAVILLHGVGQDRSVWQSFVGVLKAKGFVTLQVDQRGFGESRISNEDRNTGDWIKKLPSDVAPMIDFLIRRSDVKPERMWVIGTGLGGSVALHAAKQEPRVFGLVAVSPTQTPFAVSPADHTPSTVFALGTKNESAALDWITDAADQPKRTTTFESDENGIILLQKPEVVDAILAWILQ